MRVGESATFGRDSEKLPQYAVTCDILVIYAIICDRNRFEIRLNHLFPSAPFYYRASTYVEICLHG